MAKITAEYLLQILNEEVDPEVWVELLNEKASEPEWISVEKRLPELNQDVLSYSEDNRIIQSKLVTYHELSIGYSEGKRDRWFEYIESDYCKRHNATHWMPLPNKPV